MNPEHDRPDLATEYQNLLSMLARTGKYLEGLNADPSVLKSYRRLLRYLRSQPAERFPEIIGESAHSGEKPGKKYEPELSEQEINTMAFTAILNLASSQETPRKLLERIATVRFGVTRGGLSALRNRDALVEKLRTLIGNESTHDSITRAAGQQSPGR
jgi:hypothetical protein